MADFTLNPDFTFDEASEFKTLISEAENGVEQRRPKWGSSRKRWQLQYRNRPAADLNTAKNFFISKLGPFAVFTWVNPNDSAQYNVRFADDSLQVTRHDGQLYDFQFSLLQVK